MRANEKSSAGGSTQPVMTRTHALVRRARAVALLAVPLAGMAWFIPVTGEPAPCRHPDGPTVVQAVFEDGVYKLMILEGDHELFSAYSKRTVAPPTLGLAGPDPIVAVMSPSYRSRYFYLLARRESPDGELESLEVVPYCRGSLARLSPERLSPRAVVEHGHAVELDDEWFAVKVSERDEGRSGDRLLVWKMRDNTWHEVGAGDKIVAFDAGRTATGGPRLTYLTEGGELVVDRVLAGEGIDRRRRSTSLSGVARAGNVRLVDFAGTVYLFSDRVGLRIDPDSGDTTTLYRLDNDNRCEWHDYFFDPEGRRLGVVLLYRGKSGRRTTLRAEIHSLPYTGEPEVIGSADLSGLLEGGDVSYPRLWVEPNDDQFKDLTGCLVFNSARSGQVKKLVIREHLEPGKPWEVEVLDARKLGQRIASDSIRVLGASGSKERVFYDPYGKGDDTCFNCALH